MADDPATAAAAATGNAAPAAATEAAAAATGNGTGAAALAATDDHDATGGAGNAVEADAAGTWLARAIRAWCAEAALKPAVLVTSNGAACRGAAGACCGYGLGHF